MSAAHRFVVRGQALAINLIRGLRRVQAVSGSLDVSVAGIFRETEGLDGAVFGLAPTLEELERLIAEQCEAHAAAALNFGGV